MHMHRFDLRGKIHANVKFLKNGLSHGKVLSATPGSKQVYKHFFSYSRIKVMQVFGNQNILVADHSQVKDLDVDWCTLIC